MLDLLPKLFLWRKIDATARRLWRQLRTDVLNVFAHCYYCEVAAKIEGAVALYVSTIHVTMLSKLADAELKKSFTGWNIASYPAGR